MIIYTPLAIEDIFPTDSTDWQNLKDVPIEHGMVTIRKASTDRWEVCSLKSTNPQDYLHPKFQPGTEWKL